MTRAVIFANGELEGPEFAAGSISATDVIIAADGGLRHVLALGLVPGIVIGDFDSAPSELVQLAERRGADTRRFPREKDQTDLELALDAALDGGARDVVIFGGAGGRIDHALANVFLLANDRFSRMRISMRDESYSLALVRDAVELEGRPGDVVTLISVTETVSGVTTGGLRYALDRAPLTRGSSLGVSNVMVGERTTVRVESGLLLVIHVREPSASL